MSQVARAAEERRGSRPSVVRTLPETRARREETAKRVHDRTSRDAWSRFGLATNDDALYTFSFLMLLYFAAFSVASARERRWFWATVPSKTFMSAIAADAIAGTVLTFVGLPGLMPLPWWQMLAVFAYAMFACLVLNDVVKVAMIRWLVPNAVAGESGAVPAASKG